MKVLIGRRICNNMHEVVYNAYSMSGVRPPGCFKRVLYRNGLMDQAGYRHRGYAQIILHRVIKEVSKIAVAYFHVEPRPKL